MSNLIKEKPIFMDVGPNAATTTPIEMAEGRVRPEADLGHQA
jgi:hypothetical protein